MGQVARVQAQCRHRVVIYRATGNERRRLRAGGRQEARDVVDIVLAIGIDLQHVAVAVPCGARETGQHRTTLALVAQVALKHQPVGILRHERIEHARAIRRAAVIHQNAEQVVRQYPRHDLADGMFMVVDRDDDAGLEHD